MPALNYASSWVIFLLGYLLFGVLTAYPVEFWRKTPYLFGNLFAIYLFHNILLCPCASNSLSAALSPSLISPISKDSYLLAAGYSFIVISFASTYVVNNLLGRRTGHCLSFVLRSIFFFVILSQTLSVLIVARLMIVSV